jgi:hypothetical protein
MRRLAIVAFLFCLVAGAAAAEICDVGYGSFEIPEGFNFKRTGTIDSFMGTLTRSGDGFTIAFDIGHMAGTHMGESHKQDCTFYQVHRINDIPAFTGIQPSASGRKITTTIYDRKRPEAPANFWAEITKDSDIAEFLLIVSTYTPKIKDHP